MRTPFGSTVNSLMGVNEFDVLELVLPLDI